MGVFYGISNINALSGGLGSGNTKAIQIPLWTLTPHSDTLHSRWVRGTI